MKNHLKSLLSFADSGLVVVGVKNGSLKFQGDRLLFVQKGQIDGDLNSAVVAGAEIVDAGGMLGSLEKVSDGGASIRLESKAGHVSVPKVNLEIATLEPESEFEDANGLKRIVAMHEIDPPSINQRALFFSGGRALITDGWVMDVTEVGIDFEGGLSLSYVKLAKPLISAADDIRYAANDKELQLQLRFGDDEAIIAIPRVAAPLPLVEQVFKMVELVEPLISGMSTKEVGKVMRYAASKDASSVDIIGYKDKVEIEIFSSKVGGTIRVAGFGNTDDAKLTLPPNIYKRLARKGAKRVDILTREQANDSVIICIRDDTGVDFVSVVRA